MTERISKNIFLIAALLFVPVLAYAAYTHPWYFTSQRYLTGLIFLEFLVAAVWMYRRMFFVFVLVPFLLAGINLPVGTGWTAARWIVLGAGALIGLMIMFKDHLYRF